MIRYLSEDIRCVFERDPAARHMLEVLTCYPGVHALIFYRISHLFWTRGLKWVARVISHLGRIISGIEIHPGAKIGRKFFIDHGMGVVIGETAEIGDNCTLYHGVTLGGTSWQKGKRHPTLKNNIIIGAGAKVLGPVTIQANVRIGSNAVVISDVGESQTIVGVPGRIRGEKSLGSRKSGDKFEAYGVVSDAEDPISESLEQLTNRIQKLEKEMTFLKKRNSDN